MLHSSNYLPFTNSDRILQPPYDADINSLAQIKYNTPESNRTNVGPWGLGCSLITSITLCYGGPNSIWTYLLAAFNAVFATIMYLFNPSNGLISTRYVTVDSTSNDPLLDHSKLEPGISESKAVKKIKVFRPWLGFKKDETLVGVTGNYFISVDGWRYEKAFVRV